MPTRHRSKALFATALALSMVLMPALSEARASKGSSFGSRGSRTYDYNGAKPMERSATPQTTPQQTAPQQTAPQQAAPSQAAPAQAMPGQAARQPGFFQRNPMVGGLMAGLAGAGIFALLAGNFGNIFGAGLSGFLGVLLQVLVIFLVVRFALKFFRRKAEPVPAYGHAPAGHAPLDAPVDAPMQRQGSHASGAGAMTAPPARLAIPVTDQDLTTFQSMLGDIQIAWSRGDAATLNRLATPEMAGYMLEMKEADRADGLENRVESVTLLKGDLDESWQEGDLQYVTVTMRWSAVDYVLRVATGEVVSGDDRNPVEATEVWTMARPLGGEWKLSAIQQV